MKRLLMISSLILLSQVLSACHQQTQTTQQVEQKAKQVAKHQPKHQSKQANDNNTKTSKANTSKTATNYDAIEHANAFADTYGNYCRYLKNLFELDELLSGNETISPNQAKQWLDGHKGRGYVIPSSIDKKYDFIVLRADRINRCVVVANNVDVDTVLQTFQDNHVNNPVNNHVTTAESPIKISQTQNSVEKTERSIKTVIAYELKNHLNAENKITTESFANGDTQAVYTATMVYKGDL